MNCSTGVMVALQVSILRVGVRFPCTAFLKKLQKSNTFPNNSRTRDRAGHWALQSSPVQRCARPRRGKTHKWPYDLRPREKDVSKSFKVIVVKPNTYLIGFEESDGSFGEFPIRSQSPYSSWTTIGPGPERVVSTSPCSGKQDIFQSNSWGSYPYMSVRECPQG